MLFPLDDAAAIAVAAAGGDADDDDVDEEEAPAAESVATRFLGTFFSFDIVGSGMAITGAAAAISSGVESVYTHRQFTAKIRLEASRRALARGPRFRLRQNN